MASDNVLFHQRHRAGFGRVLAMLKLGKPPEEIGEACKRSVHKFLRSRDGKWPELVPTLRLLANACEGSATELPGLFSSSCKSADFHEQLKSHLRQFDGSPTLDVVRDFAEKVHARHAHGLLRGEPTVPSLQSEFANHLVESVFVGPMMDDFGAQANAEVRYLGDCKRYAADAVRTGLLEGWNGKGTEPIVPVGADEPLAIISDEAR